MDEKSRIVDEDDDIQIISSSVPTTPNPTNGPKYVKIKAGAPLDIRNLAAAQPYTPVTHYQPPAQQSAPPNNQYLADNLGRRASAQRACILNKLAMTPPADVDDSVHLSSRKPGTARQAILAQQKAQEMKERIFADCVKPIRKRAAAKKSSKLQVEEPIPSNPIELTNPPRQNGNIRIISDFYARTQPHDTRVKSTRSSSKRFTNVGHVWQCTTNDCDFNTTSNVQYVLHIQAHLQVGLAQVTSKSCKICHAVFKSENDLVNHARALHEGRSAAYADVSPVECEESCSKAPHITIGTYTREVISNRQTGVVIKAEPDSLIASVVPTSSTDVADPPELEPCVCYICSKAYIDNVTLLSHMQRVHNAADLPYSCKLCGFESSLLDDVVYHFNRIHKDEIALLCTCCLHVVKGGTVDKVTDDYLLHTKQHLEVGVFANRCEKCQLCFTTKALKIEHILAQHHRQRRIVPLTRTSNDDKCVRAIPMSDDQTPITLAQLEASNRYTAVHHLPIIEKQESPCLECFRPMELGAGAKVTYGFTKHYSSTMLGCALCKFSTQCKFAIKRHMLAHEQGHLKINLHTLGDKTEAQTWKCACGYSTSLGNQLANHMGECSVSNGTAKVVKAKRLKVKRTGGEESLAALLGMKFVAKPSRKRTAPKTPLVQAPKRQSVSFGGQRAEVDSAPIDRLLNKRLLSVDKEVMNTNPPACIKEDVFPSSSTATTPAEFGDDYQPMRYSWSVGSRKMDDCLKTMFATDVAEQGESSATLAAALLMCNVEVKIPTNPKPLTPINGPSPRNDIEIVTLDSDDDEPTGGKFTNNNANVKVQSNQVS